MIRARVLITGFGPFPGVRENISGRLAERLACSEVGSRCAARAELLPTEWEEVARRAPRLLEEVQPRLVLHLGVSMRSRTIRVERFAHNRVAAREDARGALPSQPTIRVDGKPRLDTTLPAVQAAKHLRSHGLPALSSSSAGSYLCNFLYYLSLDWSREQSGACDVCFVHVPAVGRLSGTDLQRGGELILNYLVDYIAKSDSRRAHILAFPSRAEREGVSAK